MAVLKTGPGYAGTVNIIFAGFAHNGAIVVGPNYENCDGRVIDYDSHWYSGLMTSTNKTPGVSTDEESV